MADGVQEEKAKRSTFPTSTGVRAAPSPASDAIAAGWGAEIASGITVMGGNARVRHVGHRLDLGQGRPARGGGQAGAAEAQKRCLGLQGDGSGANEGKGWKERCSQKARVRRGTS